MDFLYGSFDVVQMNNLNGRPSKIMNSSLNLPLFHPNAFAAELNSDHATTMIPLNRFTENDYDEKREEKKNVRLILMILKMMTMTVTLLLVSLLLLFLLLLLLIMMRTMIC